ncbi:hypothetical protein BsWGS_07428 [Bradybaena similaris]
MQEREEDSFAQHAQNFLRTLYKFTCNYQGYTCINFLVLGLNMTLLWVINYNIHKRQAQQDRSLMFLTQQQNRLWQFQPVSGRVPRRVVQSRQNNCAASKKQVATEKKFPTVTKTHGKKRSPLKANRKSLSKSTKKSQAVPEDDVETLDEITWGNDDSVSPVFSPKAVRHSEGFFHSSPERALSAGLKQKVESPQRQNKVVPKTVLSKTNQHLVIDNLDKWGAACKSVSPTRVNKGISPNVKHANIPTVDVTPTKKLKSCKTKLKAPAKTKSPTKRKKRQHTDFLLVKPLVSKYPTIDKDKTNLEPTKSYSGRRRSPSSWRKTKKFTKKRNQQSSNWNIEVPKPHTVIVSVSSSGEESPRSSSEIDKQTTTNPSDSSVVLQRDSWIWFSPETRPNAENFASRQRKFRSLDPRVDALAEEIRRQDELNRDIERTAESLADSSSHSTARAASVGVRCRPGWPRKSNANKGSMCKRSTAMPCPSVSKLNHTRKCVASPNRGTVAAPNTWPTTPRSASFCDIGKHRIKVGNTKRSPDKYNREVCGVKLPVDGRSKKTDGMRTSCREGDKTNDITLFLKTDDINAPNIEVQSLTTNKQISDSHRGMLPVSSDELLESTKLGPSFRHSPKQWIPYDGRRNVFTADLISEPTSFPDVNTLDVCASSTNTQYTLPLPESGRDSSIISTSRDSTQLQPRIHRESLQLCERQESCRASNNSLRLRPKPRVRRSFRSPSVGSASKSDICRQLLRRSITTRAADGSRPDSYPNPEDLAEKMACGLPISSPKKQPAWLTKYYCQLVAESNLRASEHHQEGSITAGGGNSQVALSSLDCEALHTDKPVLGQTCLKEIISAEVTAIIDKLLLESECGTASFLPSYAPENSSAVPSYEMCKSSNNDTQNFLVNDNISPATNVVQYPNTALAVPHSQGATSKSLTESLNSVRSDCVDTYLLDSTQSKRKKDRPLPSNFSCSETKTKNEKRINIYSKAYYLGKRTAMKKKQENTKTLLQTRPKASLSQWKKPYITWSKTVSLHLYSPTHKLSPRSQMQQKKYEQYMRKLKPCLKVPHIVAEQSPKCSSLSEESLHLDNSAQSVSSNSILMPLADIDTDAFNRSNCQAPFSSALTPNTKQNDAVSHVPAKQANILPCTSSCETKHGDLIWNHLSAPNTPAHMDVSTRTGSRRSAVFGRQTAGVSTSFTASNSCRKAGASGCGYCRPVGTLSNNNSSSSVLPYQSPTPVASERLDPPSSQVNQLFFVSQTKTWPNQVCLQNTDSRLQKCHRHENPENFEIYKTPSKMCSLGKVHYQSVHSVEQDTQESFRNPADNIVLSEHKMHNKRGSAEELLIRPHSFKGQTEGVGTFPKHKMTIYENATEKHYSDICVTTGTNDIISGNPHFLKSCLLKQQVPSTATKKQDLLMPLVKMLSPMTSSDEEHSLSDELTAENHGISRGEQTRPTCCTSDTHSHTYSNYQIPVVSSVVTIVSNPDSGFDEPVSDTVCLDHIEELFPTDSPKHNIRPARFRSLVESTALAEAGCRILVDSTALTEAMCRSLVDSTALTEARCQSESPCSEVSQVSDQLQRDIESAKFSECAPKRYYINTQLDTFETEYDAFDIACDRLDMRSDILGIDEGFFNAESAKITAGDDTFDTEYDKFCTEHTLDTENVKFIITYDKFNNKHNKFNRENGQFNTGLDNFNNEHDGFNTENNMFNFENVKCNVGYCNFSSNDHALNIEPENFINEYSMFKAENDYFNTEHCKLNEGNDKFNSTYNELNNESENENTEHERFKTESPKFNFESAKLTTECNKLDIHHQKFNLKDDTIKTYESQFNAEFDKLNIQHHNFNTLKDKFNIENDKFTITRDTVSNVTSVMNNNGRSPNNSQDVCQFINTSIIKTAASLKENSGENLSGNSLETFYKQYDPIDNRKIGLGNAQGSLCVIDVNNHFTKCSIAPECAADNAVTTCVDGPWCLTDNNDSTEIATVLISDNNDSAEIATVLISDNNDSAEIATVLISNCSTSSAASPGTDLNTREAIKSHGRQLLQQMTAFSSNKDKRCTDSSSLEVAVCFPGVDLSSDPLELEEGPLDASNDLSQTVQPTRDYQAMWTTSDISLGVLSSPDTGIGELNTLDTGIGEISTLSTEFGEINTPNTTVGVVSTLNIATCELPTPSNTPNGDLSLLDIPLLEQSLPDISAGELSTLDTYTSIPETFDKPDPQNAPINKPYPSDTPSLSDVHGSKSNPRSSDAPINEPDSPDNPRPSDSPSSKPNVSVRLSLPDVRAFKPVPFYNPKPPDVPIKKPDSLDDPEPQDVPINKPDSSDNPRPPDVLIYKPVSSDNPEPPDVPINKPDSPDKPNPSDSIGTARVQMQLKSWDFSKREAQNLSTNDMRTSVLRRNMNCLESVQCLNAVVPGSKSKLIIPERGVAFSELMKRF